MKKQLLFLVLLLAVTNQLSSRTNILRSYDINFKNIYKKNSYKNVFLWTTFGVSQKARNKDGDKVPSPQYLFADQNALAMLKGMPENSEATAIAQDPRLNIDDDDGTRGHYVVDGNFNVFSQFVIGGQYHFDNQWTLECHVPFYHMKYDNITWENQTPSSPGDDNTGLRQLLTDNFFSNVAKLGDGLNLQDWEQRGVGDATFMMSWNRSFFQNREWLKQVHVNARAGITFPTGIKKNEDKAFALAFGNDGAYSVPFGAGLDLRFKELLWVGVNATFEHIFSHTKTRRIMTDISQTNYLLLQKVLTRKEYGFIQMFNLYLEPKISDAFSLRFAYAHTKKGDDKLFVLSEDYSNMVANKNIALEESTTHDLIIQFNWDASELKPNAQFTPAGSIFAQVPFNARGSLQSAAIGFSVDVVF